MNNIKNVSLLSVLSLIVSVVALALYAAVFENSAAFIPWIISSVLSVILPIVSKYVRNRKAKTGKTIEITAFVIGAFDLYCVLFATTRINIYIVFLIITIISILYAKLFNYVMATPKQKDEGENSAKKIKTTSRMPMIFCIVSCACTIFLAIDGLIVTQELDTCMSWLLICGFYVVPLTFVAINNKKNNIIISIIIVSVMCFLCILGGAIAFGEEGYDFSLEACFAFSILCISTFIQFIFSIVELVKICADKHYGSIRYRERCYKRVEKMKTYMERGIITEEEFEKNKQDILKKIR